MSRMFMCLALLITSCAGVYEPSVWDDMSDKQVHTLRLYTGTKGESLYESNFETKAKLVCKNGYDVVDKTRSPKTLMKNLYDDGYYNWVIRCK